MQLFVQPLYITRLHVTVHTYVLYVVKTKNILILPCRQHCVKLPYMHPCTPEEKQKQMWAAFDHIIKILDLEEACWGLGGHLGQGQRQAVVYAPTVELHKTTNLLLITLS